MRKIFSIIGIIITGFTFCTSGATNQLSIGATQVLVVGTIHGNHENNQNYTYYDLINIISSFQPDAICVEIPENYFRKRSYLKEMMLATIYGTENAINVYPVDWWSPGDDRSKRNEYVKTEEYKVKEKQYYELEKSDSIMQNFYAKYESLQKVWNENK